MKKSVTGGGALQGSSLTLSIVSTMGRGTCYNEKCSVCRRNPPVSTQVLNNIY